ncbi:hypothetical protein [Spartinivicinus poritis]|uniref:Uncharacterized protein n=1 Tax=Spartinivicinus poritis TaxID=2994640 RepID=A0ABT5UGP9_9GAMM|nr:hypothetical protein [Spartinivicinus sp. A2-2]MDE1465562.1 hypothetical protein [Spartinivicinus sp. A2-2]
MKSFKLIFLIVAYFLSAKTLAYEYSCIDTRARITEYNYERYLTGVSSVNKHVSCRIEIFNFLYKNKAILKEIAGTDRITELEIFNGLVDGFISIKVALSVPYDNKVYFDSSLAVSRINSLLNYKNDEEHRKIFFKLMRTVEHEATHDDLAGLYFAKADLISLKMHLTGQYGNNSDHIDLIQTRRILDTFDRKISFLKN